MGGGLGSPPLYGESMKNLGPIRNHPRVIIVSDERKLGNGIIVTLRNGFSFDSLCLNRESGFSTVDEAIESVGRSVRFSGPYDP